MPGITTVPGKHTPMRVVPVWKLSWLRILNSGRCWRVRRRGRKIWRRGPRPVQSPAGAIGELSLRSHCEANVKQIGSDWRTSQIQGLDQCIKEHPPEHDPQANGSAEVGVKLLNTTRRRTGARRTWPERQSPNQEKPSSSIDISTGWSKAVWPVWRPIARLTRLLCAIWHQSGLLSLADAGLVWKVGVRVLWLWCGHAPSSTHCVETIVFTQFV